MFSNWYSKYIVDHNVFASSACAINTDQENLNKKISIPHWTHRKVGENKIKKKICVFGVFHPPPNFLMLDSMQEKISRETDPLRECYTIKNITLCATPLGVSVLWSCKKRILYWIILPVARWYFCSCLRCMSQKIQIIIW